MYYYSAWAYRKIDSFIYFKSLVWHFLFFHQPKVLFDFWRNILFLNLSSPIWHHLDISHGEGLGLELAFASSVSKMQAQRWGKQPTYICVALRSHPREHSGGAPGGAGIPQLHTVLQGKMEPDADAEQQRACCHNIYSYCKLVVYIKVSWNFRKVLLINAWLNRN